MNSASFFDGLTEINTNTESYEKGDEIFGTITSRCNSGAFVDLNNGELAFCLGASNLRPATPIICSVISSAKKNERILVKLDSVCDVFKKTVLD